MIVKKNRHLLESVSYVYVKYECLVKDTLCVPDSKTMIQDLIFSYKKSSKNTYLNPYKKFHTNKVQSHTHIELNRYYQCKKFLENLRNFSTN